MAGGRVNEVAELRSKFKVGIKYNNFDLHIESQII